MGIGRKGAEIGLFRPIPPYSSLLYHIPVYSRLLQPIIAYSPIFNFQLKMPKCAFYPELAILSVSSLEPNFTVFNICWQFSRRRFTGHKKLMKFYLVIPLDLVKMAGIQLIFFKIIQKSWSFVHMAMMLRGPPETKHNGNFTYPLSKVTKFKK